MAKKVKTLIKLQIPAGKANPAPPVGPALGQHGLNIAEFCQKFNAATSKLPPGEITPIVITVYDDRTYTFVTKTPPASVLIKAALGIESGSANALTKKIAKISKEQLRAIAEKKMPDLNTANIEAAMRMIEGTARQMGVEVK